MPRQAILRTLCLGALCATLALTLPARDAVARPGQNHEGQEKANNGDRGGSQGQRNDRRGDEDGRQMSAQQAAAEARSRHGGRVLKVNPRGAGYDVRLLLDDGRVIKVFIGE